jgi:hypothetical protein
VDGRYARLHAPQGETASVLSLPPTLLCVRWFVSESDCIFSIGSRFCDVGATVFHLRSHEVAREIFCYHLPDRNSITTAWIRAVCPIRVKSAVLTTRLHLPHTILTYVFPESAATTPPTWFVSTRAPSGGQSCACTRSVIAPPCEDRTSTTLRPNQS